VPHTVSGKGSAVSKVVAQITMSLDGFVTGPDDGPGRGLGVGGERLHYWVFGGPWSYDEQPKGQATGVDKELLDEAFATVGAVIGGRGTYEAAGAWGGTNPWGVPMFVLTHRMQDAPPAESGFRFVSSFDEAIARANESAADKLVSIMGGADVIRQALRHGCVDELTISVAPVILGAGKRLFEGLDQTTALDQLDVKHSQWVTHLRYGVGTPTRADDRAPGSPLM